jgi:hypothetical protein
VGVAVGAAAACSATATSAGLGELWRVDLINGREKFLAGRREVLE